MSFANFTGPLDTYRFNGALSSVSVVMMYLEKSNICISGLKRGDFPSIVSLVPLYLR